jgi:hypothetical protein
MVPQKFEKILKKKKKSATVLGEVVSSVPSVDDGFESSSSTISPTSSTLGHCNYVVWRTKKSSRLILSVTLVDSSGSPHPTETPDVDNLGITLHTCLADDYAPTQRQIKVLQQSSLQTSLPLPDRGGGSFVGEACKRRELLPVYKDKNTLDVVEKFKMVEGGTGRKTEVKAEIRIDTISSKVRRSKWKRGKVSGIWRKQLRAGT